MCTVVVDKLIVRSECELSRHLTGVDLEAQVHQLVSRNQDRLPLIDRNLQGPYEVYSPTKGLGDHDQRGASHRDKQHLGCQPNFLKARRGKSLQERR